MMKINITITESELSTLLDALDKAMENTEDHREYEALSKMFDKISEIGYELFQDDVNL